MQEQETTEDTPLNVKLEDEAMDSRESEDTNRNPQPDVSINIFATPLVPDFPEPPTTPTEQLHPPTEKSADPSAPLLTLDTTTAPPTIHITCDDSQLQPSQPADENPFSTPVIAEPLNKHELSSEDGAVREEATLKSALRQSKTKSRSRVSIVEDPAIASGTFKAQDDAPPMPSVPTPIATMPLENAYINPLFAGSTTTSMPATPRASTNRASTISKKRQSKKAAAGPRRMSLGAALCIPPPPRIDNNMNIQKFLKLSLGAIGMVFGDVGVSPIFFLKAVFSDIVRDQQIKYGDDHNKFTQEDIGQIRVFGTLSFLLWVITLVCCVKYIIFVLKADKNGEGGVWALVSLLPMENEDSKLWKYRKEIFALGMVGAGFLLADGRFGTSKMVQFYGPIMVTWFLTIAAIGLYNISKYPLIFYAISPHHFLRLASVDRALAIRVASEVVLAVNGVEAMYSDLGHFKSMPIRGAFLVIVYPALMLNYLGTIQWAVLALATLAGKYTIFKIDELTLFIAIIASQANLTGCFSLIDQGISLRVFPNIRTIHTDAASAGAVYIPAFNYVLLVASQFVSLTVSEGVGVAFTMTCTTLFYILAMKYTWSLPTWQICLFSIFILLDVILVCASAMKVTSFGLISIAIGLIFFGIMYTWYVTTTEIQETLKNKFLEMSELRSEVRNIHRTQGTVVFVSNTDEDVPNVLRICAEQLRSLPENIVCMSAISSSAPFIADEERIVFRTVDAVAGIYRLVISYGYAERSIDTVNAIERSRKRGLRMKPDEIVTFVVGREIIAPHAQVPWYKKLRILAYTGISATTEGKVEYYNLPPADTLEIGSQMILGEKIIEEDDDEEKS
ncbi:hypothetical protein HDU67_000267 [Dinochytrium kinnereticum]|nr:hypothetical protein HDU67_000267 [Dinochytrium kinnereticum]